jgi:hypothetical protein
VRGSINWKTGFNRLFVVAAFVWAAFAVWYVPGQQWQEQHNLALDDWKLCFSAAESSAYHTQEVERCNAELEKAVRKIPDTPWTGHGWKDWLTLIGLAVVPPFLVYWLLRAIGLLCNWLWRGFRRETL